MTRPPDPKADFVYAFLGGSLVACEFRARGCCPIATQINKVNLRAYNTCSGSSATR